MPRIQATKSWRAFSLSRLALHIVGRGCGWYIYIYIYREMQIGARVSSCARGRSPTIAGRIPMAVLPGLHNRALSLYTIRQRKGCYGHSSCFTTTTATAAAADLDAVDGILRFHGIIGLVYNTRDYTLMHAGLRIRSIYLINLSDTKI